MNLEIIYQKLLENPGYYALIEADGTVIENRFSNWKPALNRTGFQVHLIPGSFNPLHDSHREIYQHATRYLPSPAWERNGIVCYEMSIGRVDKPVVTLEQMTERVEQFRGYAPVVISNAPRFVTKIGTYLEEAEKLVFHVGIDCITRMKDDYTLIGIQGLTASFIVYDRIMNGKLMTLDSEFQNLVPKNCILSNLKRTQESLTRSSTSIRNR